jgi:hypothetical protein
VLEENAGINFCLGYPTPHIVSELFQSKKGEKATDLNNYHKGTKKYRGWGSQKNGRATPESSKAL